MAETDVGKPTPKSPTRDIDFMDGLVADFAVAGVPDPMPVVVEAIAREGFHGSGTGPEFVIDAGGNGFLRSVADRRAPLVAERASHVDIADGAVAQMMNGFEHAGIGARLAAVLANAIVLFYGADELAAFKGVVRAGFFDVDIFAGLAGPDGHERVPVIGRGDGDGVDIFVFEQLANVDVGFRLGQAHLFDFADALAGDVFVDVADGDDFCSRDMRKAVDVIVAAAAHSADGYADTFVGAENFAAERERSRAYGDCFSRGLQKVTPLDFHCCRLCVERTCARRIVYPAGPVCILCEVGS